MGGSIGGCGDPALLLTSFPIFDRTNQRVTMSVEELGLSVDAKAERLWPSKEDAKYSDLY